MVYEQRDEAPRDLRTRAELAANSMTMLGEPLAHLRTSAGLEPLYSTSAARLLRDALWPRARHGTAAPQPSDDARPPRASRPRRVDHIPVKDRPGREPERTANAGRWLDALFREGFVVLDTETTGLSTRDEVIEVGVVDSTGAPLLETKVFPRSGRVPAASTRIHGYTLADLRGAPSWPEVMGELERVLAGRRVLAWNAPFDERMVAQSTRLWDLRSELRGFECAMRAYASVRSVAGAVRLQRAAMIEGVLAGDQAHTSLEDARLTLAVLGRLKRAAPGQA